MRFLIAVLAATAYPRPGRSEWSGVRAAARRRRVNGGAKLGHGSGRTAANRTIATIAPSTNLKEGVAIDMTEGEVCLDEARTTENGPSQMIG